MQAVQNPMASGQVLSTSLNRTTSCNRAPAYMPVARCNRASRRPVTCLRAQNERDGQSTGLSQLYCPLSILGSSKLPVVGCMIDQSTESVWLE